jgi:hypothetical protein
MEKRRINAAMRDVILWSHCTENCRQSFIRSMRGRQYGLIETQDAFFWFLDGWKAADIARLHDAVSQINTDPPPQPSAY